MPGLWGRQSEKGQLAMCKTVFAAILTFPLLFIPDAGAGEDFDWQSCAGQPLLVLLNRHPYAEMIVRKFGEFEDLTGIKVAFAMVPEERYFPKLDASFQAEAGRPDVFMTGAYQV